MRQIGTRTYRDRLTEDQRTRLGQIIRQAQADGAYSLQVRPATYCGPDSAGDRGELLAIASYVSSGPQIQTL